MKLHPRTIKRRLQNGTPLDAPKNARRPRGTPTMIELARLHNVSVGTVYRRRKSGVALDAPVHCGPGRTRITLAELADLHGIRESTIRLRSARGLGMEQLVAPCRNRAQPIRIDGVTYPSIRAASVATGLYYGLIVEIRSAARSQAASDQKARLLEHVEDSLLNQKRSSGADKSGAKCSGVARKKRRT